MALKFRKTKENFVCGHCGEAVVGNGYTNHCPHCLWSKHVDVHPGDRAADCLGLMAPVGYVATGGEYVIIHVCSRCGARKPNKLSPDDDLACLAALC